MGEAIFEKDRNRFDLSERLVVELFLLSYIYIFFLGTTGSGLPYIWLFISIVGGILAYFIFYSRDYSLGLGLVLSLGLMVPLILFGAPLINILLFFVYVFWRIQANFNGSRIHGWPFITVVNTSAFLIVLLLAKLMFVNIEGLMEQQLTLYLLTTFLFYVIRMITITINSWQLGNFKVREAGKVFSIIVGIGASVFLLVLIAHESGRLLLIETIAFLFVGITTFLGKTADPLMNFFNQMAEKVSEDKAAESVTGFLKPEQREATSSIFEYSTNATVFIVLIIIIVVLILVKKKTWYHPKQVAYSYSFKGKRKQEIEPQIMLYDYSAAQDEVRKSFEQFEKEAQRFKFVRHHEETVKEWFVRMGWEKSENVMAIYNAVRYGTHTPSETEKEVFSEGLDKISESYFVKEKKM